MEKEPLKTIRMTVKKTEPEHVLLAEDDEDDYLIFSLALQETQLAAVLARVKNGDELMASLEVSLPDILFLDLRMPCKDGRQCLKEIRANPRFDQLPVIIHSSFTDRASIDYCFEQGGTRYTVKPDTVQELARILRTILFDDWRRGITKADRTGFVINPQKI